MNSSSGSQKSWGGSRSGSGRPKLEPTVAVRIPASMLDAVKAMSEATKLGHVVEYRIVEAFRPIN